MTTQPISVISGVGSDTGAALARRCAGGGHRVALLARKAERLAGIERELPGAKGYSCDVSDAAQVETAAERIEGELGTPTTLVHKRSAAPSIPSSRSTPGCSTAISRSTRWGCSAIAEELWHLTRQTRSGWSFNVDLRPFCEIW